MARYIDADKLIHDIKYCLWDWDSVDGITTSSVLKQTITDIEHQPAVDVAPVIHAYWIMGDGTKYDEGKLNIMHCSNCKALFRYQGRKKNINYCYRCGAVMEGIKDAKIHKHR